MVTKVIKNWEEGNSVSHFVAFLLMELQNIKILSVGLLSVSELKKDGWGYPYGPKHHPPNLH